MKKRMKFFGIGVKKVFVIGIIALFLLTAFIPHGISENPAFDLDELMQKVLEEQSKISSSIVMWKFEAGNKAPSPVATVNSVTASSIPKASVLSALFFTFKNVISFLNYLIIFPDLCSSNLLKSTLSRFDTRTLSSGRIKL